MRIVFERIFIFLMPYFVVMADGGAGSATRKKGTVTRAREKTRPWSVVQQMERTAAFERIQNQS